MKGSTHMRKRSFGTIEKLKSGNYRAYWRERGVTVRARHTFPNKKAAQEWLAAQQTALANGTLDPLTPQPEPEERRTLTFEEWKDIYLDRCEQAKTLKAKTLQSYKSCYNANLAKTFGDRLISQISQDDVRRWYQNFDPTRPGARTSTYRVFSALMNAAVEEGLIEVSPVKVKGATSRRRRPIDHPRNITITPKEAHDLAAKMPPELAITVLLGFWCAMRFGEITELRRKDIEISKKTAVIHIRRSVEYAAGYGYVVDTPKTEAGVRDIAVPPAMLEDLRRHLDVFTAPSPDSLLVHSPASIVRHLSNKSLNHYFGRALAEVPEVNQGFTFHGLRHSGLTYAGQCGATLAELMARAGHADMQTALIYQHATRERDRDLAERMSRELEK